MTSVLAGTWRLVRLGLRRDRLRLTIWVATLGAFGVWSVAGIKSLYPTAESLAKVAKLIETNTAIVALSGPPRALDTLGGRVSFEVWQYCLAVALMATLLVVRHTRAEEEAGRAELLRATVIGRHAQTAAALILAVGASAAVGVLMAVGLVAQGLSAGGALTLGAAFAMIGVAFAGVALVASQVAERGRAANGLAAAVIGVAYLLRAVGDTGRGWASWLSPFGWSQASWPFSGNRWWPLGLALVVTAALVVLAVHIERRRDHGAGLLVAQPGPATAAPALGSAFGIAWRQQRGAILAWAVGVGLGGLMFGTLANDIEKLLADNPEVRDYLAAIGGASPADLYMATILSYMALAATGFAIQSVLRLQGEETAGRAGLALSTGISRRRWVGGSLVVTGIGVVVLALLAGLSMGLAYAWAVGDAGQIPRMVSAGLVDVAAIVTLPGLAMLAFGGCGRCAAVAWGYLAFCIVDLVFGVVLRFPDWLRDLSPFHHLAELPVATPPVTTVGALLVITAVAVTGGLVAYGRRDAE